MIIAAAQLEAVPGDVKTNTSQHLHAIEIAARHNVDLILFPELSLTGYEPSMAARLNAIDRAEDLFNKQCKLLQAASDKYNMTLCVGLPQSHGKTRIGMRILQPEAETLYYAKQRLHVDEMPFFKPGADDLVYNTNGIMFAPAICYEALLPETVERFKSRGAEVYLASTAKEAIGVRKTHERFAVFAQQHQMTILLANSVGACHDFVSAGLSAVWTAQGQRTGHLDAHSQALLISDERGSFVHKVAL